MMAWLIMGELFALFILTVAKLEFQKDIHYARISACLATIVLILFWPLGVAFILASAVINAKVDR